MNRAQYKPSKADIRWRDAIRDGVDGFEKARLLRDVSHEHLAVMLHANSGPTSAGFRAMLEAEQARRGSMVARRANWIAAASLAVSLLALVIAVVTR